MLQPNVEARCHNSRPPLLRKNICDGISKQESVRIRHNVLKYVLTLCDVVSRLTQGEM
jgi:hypothetical protein